ncbi:cytochrome-c peroxidase [Ferruginibacter lapsinanis]|uniref:cytochrome-c peroxidase n=1 Tax=Ferruginibacter lapsinanis TaxID=563172 RepID=UPI001E2EE38D|nr:cytochrome-c peroxidase [Ferruginibacter lapsinanis]UEG49419.1 cytochrome-c peroxidase [Ferruginibacter lapsinanis]
MKKIIAILSLIVIVVVFQFCSKNDAGVVSPVTVPSLPVTAFNYLVGYPAHIQTALLANDNTPVDNPITNDGATLGRVLFYDKILSKNNSISCGSCHKQDLSFDDETQFSKGFDGGLTTRNSMSLLNLRFYKNGKMFWDERAATLEKQALQPIQNHDEMGLTLAELESKVKAQTYYPSLFQKAFGTADIDSVRIAKALAQFERSIVTYQSKYDQVKQGTATFTTLEDQGEQLFLTAVGPGGGGNTCATCHTPPMFLKSNVPGFSITDIGDTVGINGVNKFKSGSLRNIGTRTKLFHDGSVTNLSAMLTAGAPGSGTIPIKAHSVAPGDVQKLLAFLNTLTDNTITTEEKFSNPFK